MKKLLLIVSAMIMTFSIVGCSTMKGMDKNSNGIQMQNKFEGD